MRRHLASCTCFYCSSTSSSKSPPSSTRRLSGHAPNYRYDDCCFVTDAHKKTALGWDSNASRQSDAGSNTALSAAGPWVRNYLLTNLRQPDLSYSLFRQSLKTFLFGQWTKAPHESPLTALWVGWMWTHQINRRFELNMFLNDKSREVASVARYPTTKTLFFKYHMAVPSSAPVVQLFSIIDREAVLPWRCVPFLRGRQHLVVSEHKRCSTVPRNMAHCVTCVVSGH